MRGTIAGKRDVVVDAAPDVSAAAQPAFEVKQSGSHTLQSRGFAESTDLRARLIEATVQAIADGSGPRLHGSGPRLHKSRLWP
jgi:hypothetical protein